MYLFDRVPSLPVERCLIVDGVELRRAISQLLTNDTARLNQTLRHSIGGIMLIALGNTEG